MEDWNGMINKSSSFGGFRSAPSATRDDHHDQDFDEEDVWGNTSVSHESPTNMKKRSTSKASSSPRNIPRRANTNEAKVGKLVQQSSAPMKIPDWSKIYGKTTTSNGKNNITHGYNRGCDHHDKTVGYDDHDLHDYHDNGGDDDDDDMVPPHEWIARKLARSQISTFSVCEGIGRTLKGRDLSKVRNDILTKTGFLE